VANAALACFVLEGGLTEVRRITRLAHRICVDDAQNPLTYCLTYTGKKQVKLLIIIAIS
jgi:hypothetical protein